MSARRYCPHCHQQRYGMRTDPTRCSHCQRPFPSPEAADGAAPARPRCACGRDMDDNALLFGEGGRCSACRVGEVRG